MERSHNPANYESETTNLETAGRLAENLRTFCLSLSPPNSDNKALTHAFLLGTFNALYVNQGWSRDLIEIMRESGWPDPTLFLLRLAEFSPARALTAEEQAKIFERIDNLREPL